jgi:DNA polymerase III alpha subunit (gram-positive type)
VEDDVFDNLIDPGCMVPLTITSLTGISDFTVKGMPPVENVLRDFFRFVEGSILVINNATIHLSFQNHCGDPNSYIDTIEMSRSLFRRDRINLDILLAWLGIVADSRHRALGDAMATARAFLAMSEKMGKESVTRFIRK